MKHVALVTDAASLPVDFDMPVLVEACRPLPLNLRVCHWNDTDVDWEFFDAILLRSPWSYTERLEEFLAWCERVSRLDTLVNPLPVLRWNLDKHYLGDLARNSVPVVPTHYVHRGDDVLSAITAAFDAHPDSAEIVAKPTVGAYSKDVGRYSRQQLSRAISHVDALLSHGGAAILQPYFTSIDRLGETDMIYFNETYSHAIRKEPLLMPDGTVRVPSYDMRSPREAGADERSVAEAALAAVRRHLGVVRPLLYARVDLIRDREGSPVLLELEICEPSLSLPFAPGSGYRFGKAMLSYIIKSETDIRAARAVTCGSALAD
jgi:O-ureido-D-serine cyclo-ligase